MLKSLKKSDNFRLITLSVPVCQIRLSVGAVGRDFSYLNEPNEHYTCSTRYFGRDIPPLLRKSDLCVT